MKRLTTILLILTSLFMIFTPTVFAEETGDRVPYSVRAILPDNQVDPTVTYFDLEMEPGSTQALQVEVFNSSNEEITVLVDTNFGATNSNGVITYDGSIEEYDETMELPFDEISEVYGEELTIAPQDSTRAVIDVKIPKEGFHGELLGGIHFLLEPEEEEDQESAVGFQNAYAYVIGVNIVQAELDEEELDEDSPLREAANKLSVEEITPEIELESVEATLINHRTGVDALFTNKTPVIIDDLEFQAQITPSGEEEVLHERVVEDFSVAPNNLFRFPVDYQNAPLEPGNYTYHAKAENEDHSWEFAQDFVVSAEESEELNEAAVEIEGASNWPYYLLGAGLIIVGLIVVILYLLRKLKQ